MNARLSPLRDDYCSDYSRRARIFVLPCNVWVSILRGSKRMTNLPSDGTIVAAQTRGNEIWVRVHSVTYAAVAIGEQLPQVTPILRAVLADG